MTLTLFLVAAVVLVLVLSVLVWAMRGYRIDDHPLCRACGFDLTGKPETSGRCAECGADVTKPRSVRIGHRVARRGWAWGVGMVGALALVMVVGAGTLIVSQADPNRYKPARWLGYEALSSDVPTRHSALAELSRRLLAGQDLRSSLGGRVDELLDLQADHSTPWDLKWGDLITRLYDQRNEVDPRWLRFLSQTIHAELDYRTVVEQGEKIPVVIDFSTRADSASAGVRRVVQFHTKIRGIGDHATTTSQRITFKRGMYGKLREYLESVSAPAAGIAVDLPVTFELQAVIGPDIASNNPAVVLPVASVATVTRTFTRTGYLRVVPKSDPASGELTELGTTVDPGVIEYLTMNLEITEAEGWLQIRNSLPPSGLLAYDVHWLVNGEPRPAGCSILIEPNRPQGLFGRLQIPPEIAASSTPLLLVPSSSVAKSSLHALPIDRQVIRLTPISTRIGKKISYRVEVHGPATRSGEQP